jgi:hypothetical protein
VANYSGLFEKGSSDRSRHVNRDESVGGEQVVLSALIDDAEIALAFCVIVGQDRVDLVALERSLRCPSSSSSLTPGRDRPG